MYYNFKVSADYKSITGYFDNKEIFDEKYCDKAF